MTRLTAVYAKNQKVVHPIFGGGYVSGEETIAISGEQVRCLTIRCVSRDRKVYVPKSSLPFSKIRRPHADFQQVVQVLLGSPLVLAANFNRRMKDLKEKLDTGDTLRIAEIVRDMYRSYHANELSNSDQKLFEKTQDLMVSELALIKDLGYEEAQALLDEVMLRQRKGRKARPKDTLKIEAPASPSKNGRAVRV